MEPQRGRGQLHRGQLLAASILRQARPEGADNVAERAQRECSSRPLDGGDVDERKESKGRQVAPRSHCRRAIAAWKHEVLRRAPIRGDQVQASGVREVSLLDCCVELLNRASIPREDRSTSFRDR